MCWTTYPFSNAFFNSSVTHVPVNDLSSPLCWHCVCWIFSLHVLHRVNNNFKDYDSLPILGYLYQNGVKPTSIANGAKKMHIEVPRCRIRMIDSINFLPSALSELPKMFGLEELKKGFFTNLFNRKGNQSVKLNHLPDVHYYDPDVMKLKDRNVFFVWYETNYRQRFDFQRELSVSWRIHILCTCIMFKIITFFTITLFIPYVPIWVDIILIDPIPVDIIWVDAILIDTMRFEKYQFTPNINFRYNKS